MNSNYNTPGRSRTDNHKRLGGLKMRGKGNRGSLPTMKRNTVVKSKFNFSVLSMIYS